MGRPSNYNGYKEKWLPPSSSSAAAATRWSSSSSFWGGGCGYDDYEKENQKTTGGGGGGGGGPSSSSVVVSRNKPSSCKWSTSPSIAKKPTTNHTAGMRSSCKLPRLTSNLQQSRRQETGNNNFSPQEEELLIKLHATIGARWAIIAQQLPGRGEGEVKNLWNTKLKKKLTAMGIDPVTHKPFSQILSHYMGNVKLAPPYICSPSPSPGQLLHRPHFNAAALNTTTMASNYTQPPPLPPGDGYGCFHPAANYTDLLSELQAIRSIANYSVPGPTPSSSLSSSSSLTSPVLQPTSCSGNNNNNDHEEEEEEEEEEMMMMMNKMNSSSPAAAGFSWCDFLLEDAFLPEAGGEWGEGPQQPQGEYEDVCRISSSNGVAHPESSAAASAASSTSSFVEAMLSREEDNMLLLLDFPSALSEEDPFYY